MLKKDAAQGAKDKSEQKMDLQMLHHATDGLRCLLMGCTSRYHIITTHKAISFKLIQKLQHPRLSQPLAQTYQVVFMPCHIHVCHTQIVFMLSHTLAIHGYHTQNRHTTEESFSLCKPTIQLRKIKHQQYAVLYAERNLHTYPKQDIYCLASCVVHCVKPYIIFLFKQNFKLIMLLCYSGLLKPTHTKFTFFACRPCSNLLLPLLTTSNKPYACHTHQHPQKLCQTNYYYVSKPSISSMCTLQLTTNTCMLVFNTS